MNKRLLLVLGRLCSGKGHFCRDYNDRSGGIFHHITTSDVVKYVSGMQTRAKLQTTANLAPAISQELIQRIDEHENVIVDGIRQVEIIKALEQAFPHVQIIWLDADKEVRKQRFKTRKDTKDNIDFDQAEHGDDVIGLSDVEREYGHKAIRLQHN